METSPASKETNKETNKEALKENVDDEPKTKKVKVDSNSSVEDIRKALQEEARADSSTSDESSDEEGLDLPDYKTIDVDPDEYLQQLVEAMYGHRLTVKPALDLSEYFPEITEEQIAAYDIKVVAATRENKLQALKELYRKGQSMACCNRFGESLLHMACRRGFKDIGAFLLEEVKLQVRIRDDCGRTPMHDICWNPRMQLELAHMLLERDPTLLLICDKRGHTPFKYARPEDWRKWRKFLFECRYLLEPLGNEETRKVFQ
eukprot:CAMPEP_0116551580 /NCGR_PEP_ID=MMETSP0397-20121206/6034_1 /TAXON_ID=216820 /ORGANISM="Cyclophora tenuis, Strain ECT3854" /LENGTH=260 /DNA_ID=CAMNT_0004076483 /DNA_START=214 /DNA_END=996 /DNA_ORIENTATION=-